MSTAYQNTITVEPGKCGGKPCIRGLRITVYDVLSYLASGMSHADILTDFPPSLKPTSSPAWPTPPIGSGKPCWFEHCTNKFQFFRQVLNLFFSYHMAKSSSIKVIHYDSNHVDNPYPGGVKWSQ
jgi:hypothetical protein